MNIQNTIKIILTLTLGVSIFTVTQADSANIAAATKSAHERPVIQTKNWYAWINLMPLKPGHLYVTGEVLVGNPSVKAHLSLRKRQGINPSTLLLDLHLIEKSGFHAQVMTWVDARYSKSANAGNTKYSQVEIFYNNESIAHLNVEEVH